MKVTSEKEMCDTDSFYLEPTRCAHIGKVRISVCVCELCTVMCAREKCVCARASIVVSRHLVALTAVAAGRVRDSDSATFVVKNRTRL